MSNHPYDKKKNENKGVLSNPFNDLPPIESFQKPKTNNSDNTINDNVNLTNNDKIDMNYINMLAEARLSDIGNAYHLNYDERTKFSLVKIESLISKITGKSLDRKAILLYAVRFLEMHLTEKYLDKLIAKIEPLKKNKRISSWEIEVKLDELLKEII